MNKCIVCGKTSKTQEGLLAHQKAVRHLEKNCECHCHCIDRRLRGGKCHCETEAMMVECVHCEGKYTEEERYQWFRRNH
jgi:hypothetical protein